jgi:hypothetical protein
LSGCSQKILDYGTEHGAFQSVDGPPMVVGEIDVTLRTRA